LFESSCVPCPIVNPLETSQRNETVDAEGEFTASAVQAMKPTLNWLTVAFVNVGADRILVNNGI
jgi:hypothetical protein